MKKQILYEKLFKKKIWCFSDTHNRHGLLDIPNNVDIAIFAGDGSVEKEPSLNNNEYRDFLDWYASLVHIKHKILIGGNHDTALGKGLVNMGDFYKDYQSITYLDHMHCMIDGIKIFGSPYTPTFGTDWAFNVERANLDAYWEAIPDDADIVITHGPPKGVLDLTTYDSRIGADHRSYFQCGCKFLLEKIKTIQPKFHIFGHVHPEENCLNAGMLKIQNCETTFINACVLDLNYNVHNNGHIIEI